MTAKPQAPTLFGKRMRWNKDAQSWYGTGEPLLRSLAIRSANNYGPHPYYWFELGHWEFGLNRLTPQRAARDAERYLTRLHRALGKVVGSEGK